MLLSTGHFHLLMCISTETMSVCLCVHAYVFGWMCSCEMDCVCVCVHVFLCKQPPLAWRMMMETVCHPPTYLCLFLSLLLSFYHSTVQIKYALLPWHGHKAVPTHRNCSLIAHFRCTLTTLRVSFTLSDVFVPAHLCRDQMSGWVSDPDSCWARKSSGESQWLSDV